MNEQVIIEIALIAILFVLGILFVYYSARPHTTDYTIVDKRHVGTTLFYLDVEAKKPSKNTPNTIVRLRVDKSVYDMFKVGDIITLEDGHIK